MGAIKAGVSIVTFDEEIELAHAEMAITLTLEDEVDVSRGDVITHSSNLPTSRNHFEANVVWMTESPLLPGKNYDLKISSSTVTAQIKTIRNKIDVNTLKKHPTPTLELNEIGLVEVSLDKSVCFDAYIANRATGSFIIVDRLTNASVGAGMIDCEQQQKIPQTEANNVHVSKAERASRYGQKPATIMFIGVSGSGKSTLAHGLERRLFDHGRVSTVLDGKTMRLGISKDLPHDAEGRAENLRRSTHIARFLNDSGVICCAAFVAPNTDSREHAISVIGKDNCYLVYCNAPIDVCIQRDPSGLYAAAEGSDSADIPGLSFPYVPPEKTHLELDTEALSIEECLDQVLKLMQEEEII